MFWKKVRPALEQQWVEQLEASEHSDPTLRLADQLRNTPPVAPPLPTAFQSELRNRLVNQHPAQQPLRMVGRLAWVALALLLLVGGAVTLRFGLRYPGLQPTLSTPLPNIGQTPIAADPLVVIYDRAQLDWTANGKPISAIGESWYTADGEHIRYQLTANNGDLLSFYQDDGSTVVLPPSNLLNPVDQPLSLLYRQQRPRGLTLLHLLPDPSFLLIADPQALRTTWPLLLYSMRAKQPMCHDAFCLLGVTKDWQCHDQQCTLLDMENGRTRQVVRLADQVVDKRHFQVVELSSWVSSPAYSGGKVRLQIDPDTLALVTWEEYEQEAVRTRFQHLETKRVLRTDLPPTFFQTVPPTVAVKPRPTDPGQPSFQPDEVRVEVLAASPKAGAISQPTTITLQLRYAISPAVESITFYADLQPVGVQSWAMPPRFHHTIKPATDSGVFTVTIPVIPANLRPGFWRFNVTAVGNQPDAYLVLEGGNRYSWCIACMEAGERITVDKVYRAGSKDRILLNVAGRTVLPDDACLQTQLYANDQPVAWWPKDECAGVRERRWKLVVPLYKTGAPGKLTPGVTYSLRAWQRDDPTTEAVKEFADLATEIN